LLSYFGASLLVEDVDGDGKPELLVGSPPDRVFIYETPLGGKPSGAQAIAIVKDLPERILTPPGLVAGVSPGEFGGQLAALDFDPGQPGLEIAIGAPDLTVDRVESAGAVHIMRHDKTSVTLLKNSGASTAAGFGLGLAPLRFVTAACAGNPGVDARVLVVGSIREAFVFFRTPITGGAIEPRCFVTGP
jgi:hypothetical protein